MKKRTIIIVCVVIMFLIFLFNYSHADRKEPTGVDVVSSYVTRCDNYYDVDIVVLLNDYSVTDFEACSYEIIQNVIEDNFHSIRFDWEQSGYPNELTGTVFLSRYEMIECNPLFSFKYSNGEIGNQYNIKDNHDKYTLKIND